MSTDSLVLPAFDDTGSPSYPPRRVVHRQSVSTLVTASHFLAGNREADLKPTTSLHFYFSIFSIFPLLLSSSDIAS